MRNGKYELIVAPEGYPGKKYRERYAYEHQIVWWQNTGELVTGAFVIHHKNDEKRDNRFENLQKIHRDLHGVVHASKPQMDTLNCTNCGSEFEKLSREVKGKRKKGQRDFYCGRSCAAAHFGRGRSKCSPVA